MADDHMKTYPVVPGGNIQLEHLPSEAKDAAMGRYMDSFSRLEGMVHLAIGLTMQTDIVALGSIFALLGTKQSIDLLDATAQTHLSQEGSERVRRICERLGRRNMRRNHIVHGSWVQAVVVSDECVTQEWVRTYQHTSPAIRGLPHTDPKVAGIYAFTVQGLINATEHVNEMIEAVSALIQELPKLRLVLPALGETTAE